jgi:AcrR family transcriptional regulator
MANSSRKSAATGDTIERLLDAAERLFAAHGYDGVGLRTLADEAGVNLNAVNYHFGSKEKLYIQTFLRRFKPANDERLALLRSAQAAAGNKPLSVEKIVECIIRPPLNIVLQHPDFSALLARNLFLPPPFFGPILFREIQPSIEAFLDALAHALPDHPRDVVQIREMFSMGTVLIFAANLGRLPGKSGPPPPPVFEFLLTEMIRFITAGLSAPTPPAEGRPPIPFPRMPRR